MNYYDTLLISKVLKNQITKLVIIVNIILYYGTLVTNICGYPLSTVFANISILSS